MRVLELADGPGLVTIGRGVAGLTELSVELPGGVQSRGAGRALVDAVIAGVPADEVVVAAAAPGNARSLRLLLTCGFVPLGSVQLFSTGD